MRTETFEIQGHLPDMNTMIDAAKCKWGAYRDMKRTHTDRIAWTCKRIKPFNKIDITVHWICKDRMKDKDNITAGTKFILDGLVSAGVIKNDGWKEVGAITHGFTVDKKNPRIIVTLKEVGNE